MENVDNGNTANDTTDVLISNEDTDENTDSLDGNESVHNSNVDESSDGEIQFQPNTSPFPEPSDSKIGVGLLAEQNVPTANENQMVSPPNAQFHNKSIPNHFRNLDPDLYKALSNAPNHHNIPESSTKCSEEKKQTTEIDSQTLKYMLNTMHLYFPGNCHFVSKMFQSFNFLCLTIFQSLLSGEWIIYFW